MSSETFLSPEEQQRVADCVAQVELTTSGEIVPLIAEASAEYPQAQSTGALLAGLLLAVALCLLLGREDMWTALALFVAGYAAGWAALGRLPALRARLARRAEKADAVEQAALAAFQANGLHATRDRTGILLYVSVLERRVRIVADEGINAKVDPGTWDSVVADLTAAIRQNQRAEGLCAAIIRCGELVRAKFPVRHDDTDELPNLILS